MIVTMTGMTEFGALIRRARENAGLTGVELAARVGRPHSFIARVEGGKFSNPPDPRDFGALSRELRLPKETMLQALGYLDEPKDGEDGPSGDDRAFYAALGEYLPALGDPQRRHVIETARMMASAAVQRASTPGASPPAAREAIEHDADQSSRP